MARHADLLNMSFVRSADDVADLLEQLSELDATSKDVTLKIETVGGFEQLPMMLLAAMRWQDSGVSRAWDGAVAASSAARMIGAGGRARRKRCALWNSSADVFGGTRRTPPTRFEEWSLMDLNPLNKAFDENGKPKPGVNKFLDHVLRIQQPWVVKALKRERAQHPKETPAQIAKRAEKLYLRSVTVGGGAVGATAAVPGIGTIASLGLSSAAVAGYLEATALYAQAMAELHGVEPKDEQQNRTMIMALMLGEDGSALMGQLLSSSSASKSLTSKWGLMLGKSPDSSQRFDVGRSIRNMFVKRFLARQSGAVLGRALPFGLGAVVGGGANLAMARQVIKASREAFGDFPDEFPPNLALGERAEKFEDGSPDGDRKELESDAKGRKKRK
ncbi:hypothetical protein ACW9PK_07510 [Kocuria sp. MNB10]